MATARLNKLQKQMDRVEAKTNGTGQKASPSSKLDSQAVLLAQAIRSHDSELLSSMVNRMGNNWRTINITIKELPTSEVLPLLRLFDQHLRLHGKDIKNLELWLSWVNKILHVHSAYLATVPDLTDHIALVADWMERRKRDIDRLLELQGKLSFLISSMPASSEQWRAQDEKPMMEFAADESQITDDDNEQDETD